MSAAEMHKCPCDACGKNLKFPVDYAGMQIACPHCGQATFLKKPEANPARSIAPPLMAGAGRSTASPPPRSQAAPTTEDPLAGAAPGAWEAGSPSKESEEPDPFSCEFCGVAMEPAEKVCVECGERRPTVRDWNYTMIFRVSAGVLIGLGLIVIVLQWTTTSKPFGLREHARHAVLTAMGLREEKAKPAPSAPPVGTNAPAAQPAAKVDPDLVLADHAMRPSSENGAVYISGTVKNVSRYRYLGIKVKFDLKDASGSVIPGATVSAYTQTIEPGKQWEFKALVLDPDAAGYEPILPVEGYR